MKSFKEYAQDKDIETIKSILVEEGYEIPSEEQLVALLEAGLLQRLGQSKLGKAAKAATLAAAMTGAGMGQAGKASASDVGNQPNKSYSVSARKLLGDKQARQDFMKDYKWQQKNRSSGNNSFGNISLDKMSPSEKSQFIHGAQVNSQDQMITSHVEKIEDGVSKMVSEDVMIRVISVKDLGTGGVEVLIRAFGEIQAGSQQEANQKLATAIKKQCQEMGISLKGMKDLMPNNIGEAVGETYKVKIRASIVIPK